MLRLLLGLSLPLLILDQATKFWILSRFPIYPTSDHIEVIPAFFNIVRVHNTGMAFGLFNGTQASKFVFPIIAILAVTLISWLWRQGAFPNRHSRLAVGLLMAGIAGNLIDRILHGYVIDFLDFSIAGHHWPSFNVADSCIFVAAFTLVIGSFFSPTEERQGGEEEGQGEGASEEENTATKEPAKEA